MAQLTQRWGLGAAPNTAAPRQKAAAPDPARYCFIPCNGYLVCGGMSPKPTDQHGFFLLTAYQPPKHHRKHPPPSCWDAVRLGQQEHPCLLLAGVPNCFHAVPGTILTCSRDGSAWDGAMGNGNRERGGDTDPNTPPWHPQRLLNDALKAKVRLEGCWAQAPGQAAPAQCLGQRPPGCQGSLSQELSRCSRGCPTSPPGSWPPAEHLGGGQAFSSFFPPSLSKMRNLILVFTAPPRWINPFLASPSPGKSCESNAGPSGSHCSNSCFSPAALCKVL